MMERLTTDIPKSNTETLMNYAYAKNGRVYLRYAAQEDDIDLCEYVAHICDRKGCEMTPQDIMDGGCLGCECDISVLYAVAVQAAELRARLKHYEDMEEQGRLVVLGMKNGDTVFVVGEGRIVECYIDETYLDDKNGTEHLVSFDCQYLEQGGEICKGCPFNSWSQEFVSGEYSCNGEWGQGCIKGSDFGKTVFLTREEAEQALKGGAN